MKRATLQESHNLLNTEIDASAPQQSALPACYKYNKAINYEQHV